MPTEQEQYRTEIEALTAKLAAYERRIAGLEAANAELERSDKVKDDLLSMMGHELRTPLNAVLSLSRVLQEQLGDVLTERQRQSFQVISASGQHLLELINNMLDLGKIQAGKMRLHVGAVAIEDLCATALNIVRQQAEQKQVQLSFRNDTHVDMILADPLRLRQVLVNLLSNAVKFTPDGGAVGIETVGDIEHGAVRFTVWDTGVGIAPADLPSLFKPFVQIESSQQPNTPGTGLGLALSQRLVREHGGDIRVESAPGIGSRFTVELPWTLPDQPDNVIVQVTTPPASAPNNDRRQLVLLAEDNEANIFAISEYLAMYGVPVVVARTGPEAIEVARAERPGLILMDINLPRLDGLEVIRRVREIEGCTGTPIAIITALSDDNERVRTAGADHYLGKPIDLDKLDRVLNQYFAERH